MPPYMIMLFQMEFISDNYRISIYLYYVNNDIIYSFVLVTKVRQYWKKKSLSSWLFDNEIKKRLKEINDRSSSSIFTMYIKYAVKCISACIVWERLTRSMKF